MFADFDRSNLDPRRQNSDDEVWEALTKSKLAERIASLPCKLETVVSSGSSGLSVGECQLLCLARALLKSSKVNIFKSAVSLHHAIPNPFVNPNT